MSQATSSLKETSTFKSELIALVLVALLLLLLLVVVVACDWAAEEGRGRFTLPVKHQQKPALEWTPCI